VLTNGATAGQTTLTFDFDAFRVSISPESPSAGRKKYCLLSVTMKYAMGYQVAVESVTWSGYAKLDKGADAKLSADMYFSQDSPIMATASVTIIGGGVWADGL
jgi:hypothetical protein